MTLELGLQDITRRASQKSHPPPEWPTLQGPRPLQTPPELPTCEQHEPGQQEEGGGMEGRVGSQEG